MIGAVFSFEPTVDAVGWLEVEFQRELQDPRIAHAPYAAKATLRTEGSTNAVKIRVIEHICCFGPKL